MLAKGGAEVLHQGNHLLLGALGEVAVYVHFAHGLAQQAVGNAHGALPAGLLLLGTGHLVGEELPAGGVEFVIQGAALALNELGQEVGLEGFEGSLFHQLGQALEEGRLLHNHFVLGGDAGGLAHFVKADARIGLHNFLSGHGVVDSLHVAVCLAGPGNLGQGIFYFQVLGGHFLGAFDAGKAQHFLEEGLVAVVEGLVLGLEVVVAVSHTQAALAQIQNLHIAVGEVCLHTGTKETTFSVEVHLSKKSSEFIFGSHSLNLGDIRLDGLGAQAVAGGGVQGHLVEVGDLLVHRAGLGLHGGHALEEGIEVLLGAFTDGIETAITGELRAERVVFLPTAGGVLVKIFLGAHGRVQTGHVQGRGATFGRACCESEH